MPRKKLIRCSEFPYHVTSRSNNKEWFYISISDVWGYCEELLEEGKQDFGVEVDAFVLMSNHYHMCLKTPRSNIDKFMRFFNKKLGERISRQAGRINRIFGAPYNWSLIMRENYYKNVIRYIYQNPLRAGIIERCELYPFSDLAGKNYCSEKIEWLNTSLSTYECERTAKNLRKFEIN